MDYQEAIELQARGWVEKVQNVRRRPYGMNMIKLLLNMGSTKAINDEFCAINTRARKFGERGTVAKQQGRTILAGYLEDRRG